MAAVVVHDRAFYDGLRENAEFNEPFRLAPTTRKSMDNMYRTWQRYCRYMNLDPNAHLRTLNFNDIASFMHWYLIDHPQQRSLDSFYVTMRYWRMMYAHKLWTRLDIGLASQMKNYIATTVLPKHSLREDKDSKAVISVDDLFNLFHYHWTQSTHYYHTERDRIQHMLTVLLMVYTTARPSTLLETSQYQGSDASLRYRDIRLLLVRDPMNPGRTTILMTVILRLYKGKRNAGRAPIFNFFERDDNLGFCPILHVLALAFADHAFASPWLQSPADLAGLTIPDILKSVPLEWAPEWASKPIMRQPKKVREGWVTSGDVGLSDTYLRDHTEKLVRGAGFEQRITLYAFRRGAGNAINKVATVAERNHIMGHARAETFDDHYLQQIVGIDTQAAYLGTPSKDALIRLAGQMSLTRDPRAATTIDATMSLDYEKDTKICVLNQELTARRSELVARYGRISHVDAGDLGRQYKRLQARLQSLKVRRRIAARRHEHERYFKTNGTREIDRQRRGEALDYKQQRPNFAFTQRTILAELLCRNENASELSEDTIRWNRMTALANLSELCHLRESRPPSTSPQQSIEVPPKPEPLALQSQEITWNDPSLMSASCAGVAHHALQCPWCFHEASNSPHTRYYSYARISALRRHVIDQHLRLNDYTEDTACPFSSCAVRLQNETGLKNHLALAHEFMLS